MINARCAPELDHQFPADLMLRDSSELYLDLLKKCLCRAIFEPAYSPVAPNSPGVRKVISDFAQRILSHFGLLIVRPDQTSADDRIVGRGWPLFAETMMGLRRLNHLESCAKEIIRSKIPGDFLEAGCWRGGATILLLGVLKALADPSRSVWATDSFRGYPAPSDFSHPEDRLLWESASYFSVSRGLFENNVRRYGLHSEQLKILEGWFSETLPAASISSLSLLRIDVDGYESVRGVLEVAYPKIVEGGYILVEDMRPPGAKQAVEECRKRYSITETMLPIDTENNIGVFWRKRTKCTA